MNGAALRAAGAGLVSLWSFEALERRALGRAPLYSSGNIAGRLARRVGWVLGPRGKRALGALLRCSYAVTLVTVRDLCASRRGRSAGRALLFGAAIYAFERAVSPATGATPPVRTWPRGDRWLLPVHVMAFAAGAEVGTSPGSRRSVK